MTNYCRLDRCAIDVAIRIGVWDKRARLGAATPERNIGHGQSGMNQRYRREHRHCEFRHGLSTLPASYVKRPPRRDFYAGNVMGVSGNGSGVGRRLARCTRSRFDGAYGGDDGRRFGSHEPIGRHVDEANDAMTVDDQHRRHRSSQVPVPVTSPIARPLSSAARREGSS